MCTGKFKWTPRSPREVECTPGSPRESVERLSLIISNTGCARDPLYRESSHPVS